VHSTAGFSFGHDMLSVANTLSVLLFRLVTSLEQPLADFWRIRLLDT
jgi:hypothetical protein